MRVELWQTMFPFLCILGGGGTQTWVAAVMSWLYLQPFNKIESRSYWYSIFSFVLVLCFILRLTAFWRWNCGRQISQRLSSLKQGWYNFVQFFITWKEHFGRDTETSILTFPSPSYGAGLSRIYQFPLVSTDIMTLFMSPIAVVFLSLLDFLLSHSHRWKLEKVEKQGKHSQDEDTSKMTGISLLKVKPWGIINFVHCCINTSTECVN